MQGFTPAEDALRQSMAAEQANPRAAWLRDIRKIYAALEMHPELPVPVAGPDRAVFHLTGTIGFPGAPHVLAVAEDTLARALHVTFTERAQEAGPLYYVLTATPQSGLTVEIHAWARSVADPVVTGTADVVGWVRKPVAPELAVAS